MPFRTSGKTCRDIQYTIQKTKSRFETSTCSCGQSFDTIFNATVENLCVGNQSIKFYPNSLQTDKGITELEIDIGTLEAFR